MRNLNESWRGFGTQRVCFLGDSPHLLEIIEACGFGRDRFTSDFLVMTFGYGQFPWISLFLAVTWGTYGLLRKRSPLGPVEGLMLETAVMSVPALVYLIFLFQSGYYNFSSDVPTSLLLIGTGVISGLPLLVFIAGSRLINLSLIGILQYIYPTMIFLIGYFMYHETMNQGKLTGFIFIWAAILLYVIGDVHHRVRNRV